MEPNGIWQGMGIPDAELEAKADWIGRDHPRFRGTTVMYFRTAASLIRFSKYDFSLLSLALFQSVIGLERMLKVYYDDEKAYLSPLLSRAASDGVITDTTFSTIVALPKELRDRIGEGHCKPVESFVRLIPLLRNDFFHGGYWLCPDFLHLTMQVREAVDAVLDASK